MPPARVVGTPRDQLPSDRFDILEERVVHKRYLTLYDRVVRYPEVCVLCAVGWVHPAGGPK